METVKKFGELYRKGQEVSPPAGICEVCGGETEIDVESGEEHCPVCENPEP